MSHIDARRANLAHLRLVYSATPATFTRERVTSTSAIIRGLGAGLGCAAALCTALWLGFAFEGQIALGQSQYHAAALGFAMIAVAPLGWWLLLWAGAFRDRGWAVTLACVLPLLPPLTWTLPAVASLPGILVYRLGRDLALGR